MDLRQEIYVRVVARLALTSMTPQDIAHRAGEIAEAAARWATSFAAERRETAPVVTVDAAAPPAAVQAVAHTTPADAPQDEATGRRGNRR